MFQTDTIAAIATALSDSGIGIIRISGEDAIAIADRIFCTKSGKRILQKVASHTLHYGYIVEENVAGDWRDAILDEVMVSVLHAPRSYTAENTVEINCHGGVLVLQKVLEAVVKAGARLAQPGEFTKRAFLNGRIDLSKAEAVMDVIHSQNEYALKASISQLKGSLSVCIRKLRKKILYEIAFIESALDDPEHISLDGYPEQLQEKIIGIREEIKKLLDTADNGRLFQEGIRTVIVGKPNAGKSSLLNSIVGQERAIVTDVAGTTRDILTETIKLHGITLHMIDTAGIRETGDVVEQIGVEKAKQYAGDADFILYVVDSSVELDQNDREILSIIKGKKTVVLLNKSDLEQKVTQEDILSLSKGQELSVIRTSAKNHIGMKELEDKIKELFFAGQIQSHQEVMITNLRHKEALQNAYDALDMVLRSIEDGMPEDFYSIDLMSAYASLGSIIGEAVEDDLVEEIFARFCMGK